MGMRALESMIVAELRVVANDNRIRLKDLMEWSTGTIVAQAGETLFSLPTMGVNVAVKLPPPRKARKATQKGGE